MNLVWYIIRASGIVAFVFLTSSLLWGLMVSTKIFGRAIKAKGLTWLHESLGIAAVLSTVTHVAALSMDDYIGFGWMDMLIPGFTDWEPLGSALGIVAFWTLLIVTLSFYVKRWLGQRAWRSIHYLSFGTFVAALAHGVLSGTDASNPVVVAILVAGFVLVALMTTVRIVTSRSDKLDARAERSFGSRTAPPPSEVAGASRSIDGGR